ncbi:hypothetical protein HK102_000437, partial [Quaeritorhiza haematococci]
PGNGISLVDGKFLEPHPAGDSVNQTNSNGSNGNSNNKNIKKSIISRWDWRKFIPGFVLGQVQKNIRPLLPSGLHGDAIAGAIAGTAQAMVALWLRSPFALEERWESPLQPISAAVAMVKGAIGFAVFYLVWATILRARPPLKKIRFAAAGVEGKSLGSLIYDYSRRVRISFHGVNTLGAVCAAVAYRLVSTPFNEDRRIQGKDRADVKATQILSSSRSAFISLAASLTEPLIRSGKLAQIQLLNPANQQTCGTYSTKPGSSSSPPDQTVESRKAHFFSLLRTCQQSQPGRRGKPDKVDDFQVVAKRLWKVYLDIASSCRSIEAGSSRQLEQIDGSLYGASDKLGLTSSRPSDSSVSSAPPQSAALSREAYGSLISILLRRSSPYGPKHVQRVLQDMVSHGLHPGPHEYAQLIIALGQTKDVEGAEQVFADVMEKYGFRTRHQPNRSSRFPYDLHRVFGAMISVYGVASERDHLSKAVSVFESMVDAGFSPDAKKYHLLIRAHLMKGDLEGACKFYWMMVEGSEQGPSPQSAKGKRRTTPTTTPLLETYHALLTAFTRRGDMQAAVGLYSEMLKRNVKPTRLTFTHLLKGFAQQRDLDGARHVHDKMLFIGHHPDVVFYSILVDLHVKREDMEGAMLWVAKLREQGLRLDATLYNTLIDGFGKKGDLRMMRTWYEQMLQAGIEPQEATFTSMIDSHMKAGDIHGAFWWFDLMTHAPPTSTSMSEHEVDSVGADGSSSFTSAEYENYRPFRKINPSVATYTAIIDGLGRAGEFQLATKWFEIMVDEQSSLSSTSSHSSRGQSINRSKNTKPNIKTFTSLIHWHGQKGDLNGAAMWFRRMQAHGIHPDIVVYNSLVSAHALAGEFSKARMWIEEMLGNPDSKALVTATSANTNTKDHSVQYQHRNLNPTVETFGVLLDGHLRSNDAKGALEVYEYMTERAKVPPNEHIYTALITYLAHGVIVAYRQKTAGSFSPRADESPSTTDLESSIADGMRLDHGRASSGNSETGQDLSVPGTSSLKVTSFDAPLKSAEIESYRKAHLNSPYHHKLLHIYAQFRRSLEDLYPAFYRHRHPEFSSAFTFPDPSSSTPASSSFFLLGLTRPRSPPIHIYHSFLAYNLNLRLFYRASWVYLEMIADGVRPDLQATVRLVEGTARSKGWKRGAMALVRWVKGETGDWMRKGWIGREALVDHGEEKIQVDAQLEDGRNVASQGHQRQTGSRGIEQMCGENDEDAKYTIKGETLWDKEMRAEERGGDSSIPLRRRLTDMEIADLDRFLLMSVVASYGRYAFIPDWSRIHEQLRMQEEDEENERNGLKSQDLDVDVNVDVPGDQNDRHLRLDKEEWTALWDSIRLIRFDPILRTHYISTRIDTPEGFLMYWNNVMEVQWRFRKPVLRPNERCTSTDNSTGISEGHDVIADDPANDGNAVNYHKFSNFLLALIQNDTTTTPTSATLQSVAPSASQSSSQPLVPLNTTTISDSAFLDFIFSSVRMCEVLGMWEARREVLDGLKGRGLKWDEAAYRSWKDLFG